MGAKWTRVLVEGAVVVFLATVVLQPLRSSYATNDMWTIGLAGAVCATLISALMRKLPVLALIPGLFLGWLLLAGPFALRSSGFGMGIPNGETLADVMTGTATGWNDFLTTWPWVDVDGPPAMVPFVITYVAAGLASSLAFRGNSPALPAVPILLGAAAALGISQPSSMMGWTPFLLSICILLWVLARSLVNTDSHTLLSGAKSGLIGRAVVLCIALLLAAGLGFVVTDSSRNSPGQTMRGHVGTLPDTSDFGNPLSRYRTFTKQRLAAKDNVYAKKLFTFDGVATGSRVRLVALDAYDGRSWYAANDTTPGTTGDRFLRMDTTMARKAKGKDIAATVKIQRAYKGDWLPTIGAMRSLSFVYTDEDKRRNRLLFNQETNSAVIPIGIGFGNDYDFESTVPDDRLGPNMKPYPDGLTSISKGLPEAHFFVRGLAGKGTPMQKVYQMAKYLRTQGRYSSGSEEWETQFLPGHDLKRLFGSFLGAPYVVGDDEQYAAAMALLANAAGVPARVAVGAVLPEDHVIKGKDIQAWVELRVADGSWRVLPREQFTGTQDPPRTYVPSKNLLPPKPKKQDQVQNQPHIKKQQKKKQQQKQEAVKRGWVKAVLPILFLLLLLLTVPLLKWIRRRRRRRSGTPADRIAGAWSELLDNARDMGTQAPVGAARPRQAKELVAAPSGGSLSHNADEATFAERLPTDDEATSYWKQIGGEISEVKKAASWKRRVTGPFNPVTFFINRSLR
jgi:hypothetical protein